MTPPTIFEPGRSVNLGPCCRPASADSLVPHPPSGDPAPARGHAGFPRALTGALLFAALCPLALGEEPRARTTNLVVAVDLRPAFTNWGLPLRLQGGRGTCSVFTMAGAIEYALAQPRQHGPVVSVEFLNWASNDATANTHDGGFFSDLWTGYSAHGVCPETDLPYQADYDPKLRPDEAAVKRAKELAKAELRLHWIKPWDVRTGLTPAHFLELRRVLSQRWPVAGGFRWPKREQWQDGVLRMVPPADVFDGHSVLLVGFRDDAGQPGGGVFLIRNSGGGAHDAALPYEYVRAYMNDALWIEPAPPESQ